MDAYFYNQERSGASPEEICVFVTVQSHVDKGKPLIHGNPIRRKDEWEYEKKISGPPGAWSAFVLCSVLCLQQTGGSGGRTGKDHVCKNRIRRDRDQSKGEGKCKEK